LSTQLSQSTPSWIGSGGDRIYLTRDGLSTGVPLLVLLDEDHWTPLRSNGAETIGGAEYQEFNIGGASGTANRPVTLKCRGVWDVVYAALVAHRAAGGLRAAQLTLAATTSAGAQKVLAFTAVRYIADVTHESAPNYTERFAARIYRDVVVSLYSEA
jgi:hypothetical protein